MKINTFTNHQGSLSAYTGNAKEYVTHLDYDVWSRRNPEHLKGAETA